ncbi:MAG: hypothetical protein LKJ76_09395 [Lachnospiraceae bacterium]|jgi:hypothetical protein|nr:hypothetical protein [Lachnospiraceae bacterium]
MKYIAVQCPQCGATLHFEKGSKQSVCEYCSSTIAAVDENAAQTVTDGIPTKDALLGRAFVLLADGNFPAAAKELDKVLELDPGCAMAYAGKTMAVRGVRKLPNLAGLSASLSDDSNFSRAIAYGNESERRYFSSLALQAKHRFDGQQAADETGAAGREFRSGVPGAVILIFAVICLIFFIGGFMKGSGDAGSYLLPGIISFAQFALLLVSWLMGNRIIRTKNDRTFLIPAIIAAVLVVPFFLVR